MASTATMGRPASAPKLQLAASSPRADLPPSGPPQVLTGPPNAPLLLRAFLRQAVWIVPIAVLLAAFVVGVAHYAVLPQPQAKARALLYIQSSDPRVLFDIKEQRSDFNTFRQTQANLLKNRLVLNAALRQPKVAVLPCIKNNRDPLAWLEKELKVGFASTPEIMTVALSTEQGNDAKILVDAIVKAYLEEIVNKVNTMRRSRLDQLQELVRKYDEELRTKRAAYRNLADTVGTQDRQTALLKQQCAQQELNDIQRQLTQTRSDLRKLQLAPPTSDAGLTPPGLEAVFARDPDLFRYKQNRAKLREEYEKAKELAVRGADEPAVQRLAGEVERLDAAITARTKILKEEAERDAKAHVESHVNTRQQRIDELTALEKKLLTDAETLQKAALVLNRQTIEMEPLAADIAQREGLRRGVSDEIEKLSVELSAPPRVTQLEEAVIDAVESRTRHFQMLGMAGIAAFTGVGLGLSYLEFRRRRVETAEQIARGLGISVLGTLPDPTRRVRRGEPSWAEALAGVRLQLLHEAKRADATVFLVGSAKPSEGRSTLALALASNLADAGHSTLIVDGDLRKPELHTHLDAQATPGLCELLRCEAKVADTLQQAGVRNLTALAAGRCDDEAFTALGQGQATQTFTKLRGRFDYTLIDGSALLPTADALTLSQGVDAVVLTAVLERSSLHDVHIAAQKLTALGVRVLGVVLTRPVLGKVKK